MRVRSVHTYMCSWWHCIYLQRSDSGCGLRRGYRKMGRKNKDVSISSSSDDKPVITCGGQVGDGSIM